MKRVLLPVVFLCFWIPLLHQSALFLVDFDFVRSMERLLRSGHVDDDLVIALVSLTTMILTARVFIQAVHLVSLHGLVGALRVAGGKTILGLTLLGISSLLSFIRATPGSRGVDASNPSVPVEQVGGVTSAALVLSRIRAIRNMQISESTVEKLPVKLSEESVETAMFLVSTADQGLELTPEFNERVILLCEEVETKKKLQIDEINLDRQQVLVRLYGYPLVEGLTGRKAQFRKTRALELLVWLLLNRDRMRRSAARTAMWEINCTDATFSTVVSDLRRALTEVGGLTGEEFLPVTFSDELPLSDTICSDFDLLVNQRQKFLSDPLSGRDIMISLLQGIRDLPFAGTPYLWPDLDGSTTRLVVTAVATAQEVATWAIDTEDMEALMISSTAGLRLLPGDEELLKLQRSRLARRS